MPNKKILIVEDSQDIQFLLRQLFEGEGYSVVSALNGKEALDLLRNKNERPAFILLDLMMPVMDGYVFCEEQKRDPSIADIPVVIMTADGNAPKKQERVGAAGSLRKPVNVSTLLETARQYCS